MNHPRIGTYVFLGSMTQGDDSLVLVEVPEPEAFESQFGLWHQRRAIHTCFWYSTFDDAQKSFEICRELDPSVWPGTLQTSHPTGIESLGRMFPKFYLRAEEALTSDYFEEESAKNLFQRLTARIKALLP